MVLLVGVVLIDLVYRQLYSTLPLHLRDSGAPVGLYAAVISIGSGLILLLELPVTQRLRDRPAAACRRRSAMPSSERVRRCSPSQS